MIWSFFQLIFMGGTFILLCKRARRLERKVRLLWILATWQIPN